MNELSARSTRMVTNLQAAQRSQSRWHQGHWTWNVILVLPVVSGSGIFGSEVILFWNKVSGFRTSTEDSDPETCQSWSFLVQAYLRPDRKMTERPERFLDQNQRWLPCSNRKSFYSNILWSHALLHIYWCVKQHCTHTSSAHTKSETGVLWPETRRTCLKLFAWRVPNFSVLILPHRDTCLVFHWAHMVAFFHIAFKPKKMCLFSKEKISPSIPFVVIYAHVSV